MAYLNLKAEMAKRDVTAESMAKFLGIHRNSVANKLKGFSSFSIDEAMELKNKFFSDCEIEDLFNKD